MKESERTRFKGWKLLVVIKKFSKINIFKEGELEELAVVANNAITAANGKIYQVEYYNLEAILSVGYRVNSKSRVQFRKSASSVLKEYLINGYGSSKL